MIPLLVSYADLGGGAARATYRLHCAFRDGGIDSTLVVRRKLSDDDSVLGVCAPGWGRVGGRVEGAIQRLQRTPNPVLHSSNLLPTRLSSHLKADVVNLHWIGSGAMSIRDIGRIEPPVVLTLHDMWAFCGSEHYAPDEADARWVTGYTKESRPVGHHGLDLDRRTWQRKRQHWEPTAVVAPSTWLANCVGRSALMADWPVYVIPNPLDMESFRPHPRAEARAALALPQDAKIVLFGAMGGGVDPRKGFDLLVHALNRLDEGSVVLGVIFGEDEPRVAPRVGLHLRWMGQVDDEGTLAHLYSAADVMVVPSRQENLPQTATEAQACGTPVVAFRTTGLTDVVSDGETGCLAEPLSPNSLAEEISRILRDPERAAVMGNRARERAKRLWSPAVIASRYLDVYSSVAPQARD